LAQAKKKLQLELVRDNLALVDRGPDRPTHPSSSEDVEREITTVIEEWEDDREADRKRSLRDKREVRLTHPASIPRDEPCADLHHSTTDGLAVAWGIADVCIHTGRGVGTRAPREARASCANVRAHERARPVPHHAVEGPTSPPICRVTHREEKLSRYLPNKF
jgi:hypothetical protein